MTTPSESPAASASRPVSAGRPAGPVAADTFTTFRLIT